MPTTLTSDAFGFTGPGKPEIQFTTWVSVVDPAVAVDADWKRAGAAPGPPVTAGSRLWVRLRVENFDLWAFMTKFAVSSSLGGNMCSGITELDPLLPFFPASDPPPRAVVDCIVEVPAAMKGLTTIGLTVGDKLGYRQSDPGGKIFDDPIMPPRTAIPNGHVIDFRFPDGPEGDKVQGVAGTATADFGDALPPFPLSADVFVDCSDTFSSGGAAFTGFTDFPPAAPQSGLDPRIIAYAIATYDSSGRLVSPSGVGFTCRGILESPTSFEFFGTPDMAIHYEGK